MPFALYVVGFLVFIGGVAWALITAGVRPLYVIIECVILLSIGIFTASASSPDVDPRSLGAGRAD